MRRDTSQIGLYPGVGLSFALVAMATGMALGQPPGLRADPAAQRKMDDLLANWERTSAEVHSLDVTFTEEDTALAFAPGEVIRFEGRAILKSPNLAFLDFKKVVGGKLQWDQQIRCTGKEVYQYKAMTKQIFVYPLDPDQQKRALEEGPLRFLFNMKADDARRRYEMVLQTETAESYRIQVTPRQKIDREAFARAIVVLDKRTFLPRALQLLDAENGKDTKTYRFTSTKPNAGVDLAFFKGKIHDGWKVVNNPGPDGRPRPAGSPSAPTRPPFR